MKICLEKILIDSQFEISTDHNLALYKCLYWNSAMLLMN